MTRPTVGKDLYHDALPAMLDPPIESVVFGWGAAEDGQLGFESSEDVCVPRVLDSLLGTRFAAPSERSAPLVAGSRGSLALTASGSVLSWGWNARGTLGRGEEDLGAEGAWGASYAEANGASDKAKGLSAETNGSSVKSKGSFIKSKDSSAKTRNPSAKANVPSARPPPSDAHPRPVRGLEGVRVVQVSLGGWHALAVDSQARAWAWGGNEYGQCGVDSSGRDLRRAERCLRGVRVRKVGAGGMHSLALGDEGEVWDWGERWGGAGGGVEKRDRAPALVRCSGESAEASGDPSSRSVALSSSPHPIFADVAAGAFHNLAACTEGRCWAWGVNDYGQLGDGSTLSALAPRAVRGLEGVFVRGVVAGGWHSMALGSERGELFAWGRGEHGRLGLGDAAGSSRLRPCRVQGLAGERVVQAACGGSHSAALGDDGRAWVWGRGEFGRLGGGETRTRPAPGPVVLPGGHERWTVLSLAAGGRHTLLLAAPRGSGGRIAMEAFEPQPESSPLVAVEADEFSFPVADALRRPPPPLPLGEPHRREEPAAVLSAAPNLSIQASEDSMLSASALSAHSSLSSLEQEAQGGGEELGLGEESIPRPVEESISRPGEESIPRPGEKPSQRHAEEQVEHDRRQASPDQQREQPDSGNGPSRSLADETNASASPRLPHSAPSPSRSLPDLASSPQAASQSLPRAATSLSALATPPMDRWRAEGETPAGEALWPEHQSMASVAGGAVGSLGAGRLFQSDEEDDEEEEEEQEFEEGEDEEKDETLSLD